MKKRRTLIISLLLVAAMAIGVGYAALATELRITGDIASAAVKFDVQFISSTMSISTDNTADPDARKAEIQSVSSAGTTGASMIHLKAAGLKEAGDAVTYTLVLENKSDVNVTVSALQLIDTDTSSVIDMTDTAALNTHFAPFTFKVTGWDATEELEPGDTITVTIEIELAETSNVAATHAYTLKATAEPTNNSENG